MGVPPTLATAYSLFVVGAAALFGAAGYWRKGQIDFKAAVSFALPAFVAVYLTRLLLIPYLPDVLLQWGDWVLTKDVGIMVIFALLMITAAISMLRSKPKTEPETTTTDSTPHQINYLLVIAEGLVVGTLTGIVGAGGGFLIVPALVLLARLPMKVAVGTSLLIITFKSLIGFVGDLQAGQAIDWFLLTTFTGMTIAGILVGGWLANFIPGQQLKKGFGWFVLVMAAYILINELFF